MPIDSEKVKAALAICLGFFILFFVIGALQGLRSRHEHAVETILHGLSDFWGKALEHKCPDSARATHTYLVTKDLLFDDVGRPVVAARIDRGGLTEIISPIATFLGGGAGGITYKEVVKKWGKSPELTVGAILGGVSGYTLGYLTTSRSFLSCESGSVRRILDNPSEWQYLERAFFVLMLKQITDQGDLTAISKNGQWEEKYVDLLRDARIDNEKFDPKQEDFEFLSAIAKASHVEAYYLVMK